MIQLHLILIAWSLLWASACSSTQVAPPAAPATGTLETVTDDVPAVIVPAFDDEYSRTVKQLEAGHTDIDYVAFRRSFLKSDQYRVASEKSDEMRALKKAMFEQMETRNFAEIIKLTKAMLSIDYTDMMAHKILRQTYEFTDDKANGRKYKTIQFGLLRSIVDNGDGQTCPTAWPVVQIAEEYFILEMLDATLLQQSIDNTGGLCDKMEVEMKGKKQTYYFEISKIFEKRAQELGG